jgi:glycosyltransferase involved in cell wall biosynthesis
VSRVAGCAADLITEDWNGHLVAPKDVESLAEKMHSLAMQPNLRAAMGSHSVDRISKYSPEIWSTGILAMTKAAGGPRD